MIKGKAARMVLAILLGCAGGAPGRDIPVYREYTQPIRFYDERGDLRISEGAAPDRAALREMRDTQMQETMMGKETLLESAFGHGTTLFARPAPISGKITPVEGIEEANGRRQRESGQNWLAKSLSLPSLGQSPESAAVTAMAAGAKVSSWGWLAGEMKGTTDGAADLPKTETPALEPTADGQRGAALQRRDGRELELNTTASAGLTEVSAQDSPGTKSDWLGGMHSYRNDSAAAEMSQTRQMISEFSVEARPDYASLPTTFAAASAGESAGMGRWSANRLSLDVASNAGPATLLGIQQDRFGVGAGASEAAPSGIRSWQGGWSAQSSGSSVLSGIEPPAEPTPVVEDPITTYMNSKPRTSSGGYKPAWF